MRISHPLLLLLVTMLGLLSGCGFQPTKIAPIVPSTTTVVAGTSFRFIGPQLPGGTVWSVSGSGGSPGSIDATGLYIAPPVAPLEPVTVTASSATFPGELTVASAVVVNPAPTITSSQPAILITYSGIQSVIVEGTGFTPATSVLVNGKSRTVDVLSSTRLVVTLTGNDLINAVPLQVIAENPLPGGGQSPALPLSVENPAPVLRSISPARVLVASGSQDVTITGEGFIPLSAVIIEGKLLPAQYLSATELKVTLPMSAFDNAGVRSLLVTNTGPGGGASSVATLLVENPIPTIRMVSPMSALGGSSDTEITLVGSGFVADTVVTVGNIEIGPSHVSANEIHVTVPASVLATPGKLGISASNAGPGGGKAASQFVVVAPPQLSATAHPLVASYSADLPAGFELSARFGIDSVGEHETFSRQAPADGSVTTLLVAGMRPSTGYHLQAVITAPDGSQVFSSETTFATGDVPNQRIPPVHITVPDSSSEPTPGIELFDFIGGTKDQFRAAAFDLTGNLVWYYDYPTTEGYPSPVKQLSNGNMMLVISEGAEYIREVDLAGQTVRELRISDLNAKLAAAGSSVVASKIHHDIIELPQGRLAFLVNQVRRLANVNGYKGTIPVLGDAIIVVDPAFNVLWTWSTFDHLDVNRHPYFPLQFVPPIVAYDWTHSNSLAFSAPDGSLLLSIRHQSWIVKIDFGNGSGSGDILWRLGSGGDFQLSGGDVPIDWFYLEHYASVISNTAGIFDIGLFDNGDFRPIDSSGTQCGAANTPCYSRPLILRLDEPSRTATLTWSPHYWYSNWGGTFQQLASDRYEFTFSAYAQTGGSRVVETTGGTSPQVIWQADTTQPCYRAVRLKSLYPESANHQNTAATPQ